MRIEIKDRRNNIREIWYAGERTENTKWVERLERNDKEVQKSNEQGIKIVKRFKILQNLRRRQLRNRFHQCLSDIQNQCLSDIPILYENSLGNRRRKYSLNMEMSHLITPLCRSLFQN